MSTVVAHRAAMTIRRTTNPQMRMLRLEVLNEQDFRRRFLKKNRAALSACIFKCLQHLFSDMSRICKWNSQSAATGPAISWLCGRSIRAVLSRKSPILNKS